VLFLVSLNALFLKFYLKTYKYFNEGQLVATVECKKDKNGAAFLRTKFYDRGAVSQQGDFPFSADEWVIEGRIIKWKSIFTVFGLKTYYRLERISGRYFDIEKEKTAPRIVHALQTSPDKWWFLIYRFQRFFPGVDAVYGSSAFVPFSTGRIFNVYVTYTGLMIKDISLPQKRSWWPVG